MAAFSYAFNLLHLDGWDLHACALRDRKRLLEALKGWNNAIRYATHVESNAAGLLQKEARLKLEGIIIKRADAPYRGDRRADWLEVKCLGRDDFLVLGWTPPGGYRRGTDWLGMEAGCMVPAAWADAVDSCLINAQAAS